MSVVHLRLWSLLVVTAGLLLTMPPARAEEGMWPYNRAPTQAIAEKYGVTLDAAWLDHARLSSVRFNNGGSGSFVSPRGLVMTNQHVGRDCIQKLSFGAENLLVEGFVARSLEEERRCPDLELNQLTAITDVTEQVTAAADKVATDQEKGEARKAAIAQIESACADPDHAIRCDVVTLYAGGAYHLYRYQRYTDVRLVFAPENDAKHFGGEKDNFSFPRMSLDVAFFRVYVDDHPLDSTAHHFAWSKTGAENGQLVFVSGHPGATGRFSSVAELMFLRDVAYPALVELFTAMKHDLGAFMDRGPRQRQVALGDWLRAANAEKALNGYLKGLTDEELMKQRTAREAELKTWLKQQPDVDGAVLDAWSRVERAYRNFGPHYRAYLVTESRGAPGGRLVGIARELLRVADEDLKPSGARLREYRDSQRESLKLRILSEAPFDDALEADRIAFGLTQMQKVLGPDDPTVRAALAGATPEDRARALVAATTLKDVEVRRALLIGGKAAVDKSSDPLIAFVRTYDARARALRKKYEDELVAVKDTAGQKIAWAWARFRGQDVYPDATFSLRLSYGVVAGYEIPSGRVHWRTQIGDAFRQNKRARNQDPYRLPRSFLDAVGRLDFTVPYNFVSTNDIIGGNSGSPVLNVRGEIVGIIFDGNIDQLSNRFLYRDKTQRAWTLTARGIVHLLQRVYDARALVDEIAPR